MKNICMTTLLTVALLSPSLLPSESVADVHGYEEAGNSYQIDPLLLRAISRLESREIIGARSKPNKNGSVDLCHMQINSRWHGPHEDAMVNWEYLGKNATYCSYVGAWILAKCMKRYPDESGRFPARALACYHMGADPAFFEKRAQKKVGHAAEMDWWRALRGRWYANAVKAFYDWLGGQQ